MNDSEPRQEPAAPLEQPKSLAAAQAAAYWRTNLVVIALLLAVWGLVSFGGGLLAPWLSQFDLGGIPFGFWLSNNGAIFIFVLLIFVYALIMDRLDAEHHFND